MECENNACARACADDEHYTCSLCREPVYCSEQCQVIDWPLHACANLIDLPNERCGAFVPYYYEDLLTAEELSEVPANDPIFASYSTMHHNPNRTVSTGIIPSLVEGHAVSQADASNFVRGEDPEAELRHFGITAYQISINAWNGNDPTVISGTIPNNMIFKDNPLNAKAKQLAAGPFSGRVWRSGAGLFVFWPNPEQLRKDPLFINLSGALTLTLNLVGGPSDTYEPRWVQATYALNQSKRGGLRDAWRSVKNVFQRQLQIKFPKNSSNPPSEHLQLLRYSDLEGNDVILTVYAIPGDKSNVVQLVDVEFVTPANKLKIRKAEKKQPTPQASHLPPKETPMIVMPPEEEGTQDVPPPPPPRPDLGEAPIPLMERAEFTCDPLSLDEVVGLSMALEYVLSGESAADDAHHRAALEHAAGTIQEYAHAMLDNDGRAPAEVPSEVSTAIGFALDALYEPVGVAFGVDKYTTKLSGASSAADIYRIFGPIIDKMRDTMAKARNDALTGKGLRKVKAKAQKSITIRDARNLLVALSTKQQTTTITDETRNALNTLITRLNTDVLRP
jgi:hypothetical protein